MRSLAILLALSFFLIPFTAEAKRKGKRTKKDIRCSATLDGEYQKDSPLIVSKNGRLAFVTTQNGNTLTLHALTKECDILWELNAGKLLSHPSIGAKGVVYYAAVPKGKLGILQGRAPSGKEIGNYEFEASKSLQTPTIGPDGTVYLAFDNRLASLRSDLTQKWIFRTKPLLKRPIIDPNGTPYVHTFGAGTNNESLHALDPKTGKILWSFELGFQNEVFWAGDHLVALVKDSTSVTLHGISPKGKSLFSFSLRRAKDIAVSSRGFVYLIGEPSKGGGPRLLAFNTKGKLIWDQSLKTFTADPIRASLAVAPRGEVAVATPENEVVLFSTSGKKLWSKTYGDIIRFDDKGNLHIVDSHNGKATRTSLDQKKVSTESIADIRTVGISENGNRFFAGKKKFVVLIPQKP